jgi:hypothetical protein
MAIEYVLMGNVMVNRWHSQVTVEDVDTAFKAAANAFRSVGQISNLAIISGGMKMPGLDAMQRMERDQEKMLSYHRSVQYLILVGGFTASRAISMVARLLTSGTRGSMTFEKTAKDAVLRAESFGPLNISHEALYHQLRSYGVPQDRMGI